MITGDLLECFGKLEDYDELLSESGFVRLQKSFLANMQYIDRIASYNAYLQTGITIKVSEKNYKDTCKSFYSGKVHIYDRFYLGLVQSFIGCARNHNVDVFCRYIFSKEA